MKSYMNQEENLLSKEEQQRVNKVMSDIYSNIEAHTRKNKHPKKFRRLYDVFSQEVQGIKLVTKDELLNNPRRYSCTDKFLHEVTIQDDIVQV